MNIFRNLFRRYKPTVVHPPMDIMQYPMQAYLDTGKEQLVDVRIGFSTTRQPISCGMNPYRDRAGVYDSIQEVCKGDVLDIGACMGDMSLQLQNAGFNVTALDISQASIDYMTKIGVHQCVLGDISTIGDQTFDTILLLGSTLGICGQMNALPGFLMQVRSMLKENGQIIIEDANVLWGDGYSEWTCQLAYKQYESTEFPWLNVGADRLVEELSKLGFSSGLVCDHVKSHNYVLLAKLQCADSVVRG